MPYVPGFDNDLFISYASLDNDGGAVVDFVETLEKHLSDNLVNFASPKEKVKIYFDQHRLGTVTAVKWKQDLEAAASSCALLVPLVSPNYLSSPICGEERKWYESQAHAATTPFAVVGWRAGDGTPLPAELQAAQRHPPGDVWLSTLSPAARKKSAQEFAIKVRDALQKMRASVHGVFLGPAQGRTAAMKAYLRDELEKAGYRVVPEADFLFEDEAHVRELLQRSLMAIHFAGDGNTDGIPVMTASLEYPPDQKTVLIQPNGVDLSPDEKEFIAENASRQHHYLGGKEKLPVWEFIRQEVRAAGFRMDPQQMRVGIACHELDLDAAKSVGELITETTQVPVYCPPIGAGLKVAERIKASRTIKASRALLCYWGQADEKGLKDRLKPAFQRKKYEAQAWYLAPPIDIPGKDGLEGMVLHQRTSDPELEVLKPFLKELGWRPD